MRVRALICSAGTASYSIALYIAAASAVFTCSVDSGLLTRKFGTLAQLRHAKTASIITTYRVGVMAFRDSCSLVEKGLEKGSFVDPML